MVTKCREALGTGTSGLPDMLPYSPEPRFKQRDRNQNKARRKTPDSETYPSHTLSQQHNQMTRVAGKANPKTIHTTASRTKENAEHIMEGIILNPTSPAA